MRKILTIIIIVALSIQITSLKGFEPELSTSYWPTDDWQTEEPENVQMDEDLLNTMDTYINESIFGLDSIVLVKNGYIVFERYYRGYSKDVAHQLYSCTKSVTSALVGIAIDQGLFTLNDYVLDYFDEYTFENVDSRKQNITIEHLLNMQSGLDWDEWSIDYFNSLNQYNRMLSSLDWVQFILDTPMATEPGSTFVYCGGASHLLQAIIDRTANVSAMEFANTYLFDPLGINVDIWTSSPNNVVCGAHGLHLTPRDMAKFGYLFMNNGSWDGHQIIPKDWVWNTTRNNFIMGYYDSVPINYGYQWWAQAERLDYYTFYASGYQGQRIHCFPELDLIFITTASIVPDWFYLLETYIIPAITEFENTTDNLSPIYLLYPIMGLVVIINKKKKMLI